MRNSVLQWQSKCLCPKISLYDYYTLVPMSANWLQRLYSTDMIENLTVLEWDYPGCVHRKAIPIPHGAALQESKPRTNIGCHHHYTWQPSWHRTEFLGAIQAIPWAKLHYCIWSIGLHPISSCHESWSLVC